MNDPLHVTKLQRCYLSEEEMLAQEAVANHYTQRVAALSPEPVTAEI